MTGQDGVYTFTMPASDVTITAAFKAIDYPVIVEKAENGTVTADKKTANIGDETPLAMNIAMLVLSALSIVAVVYYKRRDY